MPEVFYEIWTGEYLCSDLCGAKFLWVLETFYEIYWAEQKLCKEKWLMLLRYFSQVWVNISTAGCLMWSTTFWLFLFTACCIIFFFSMFEWYYIHLLWAPPSGWFVLVQAISFNGCVVVAGCLCSKILSGTTSVFCEHHLLVCSCYFRLYLLMVLVSFCFWLCLFLFTDSKWSHPSGNKAWNWFPWLVFV